MFPKSVTPGDGVVTGAGLEEEEPPELVEYTLWVRLPVLAEKAASPL